MRLTSTLTVAMVLSVCFAGCAARRCCKCCCHQDTVTVTEKTVATEEPEVPEEFEVTLDPEPVFEPEPAPQKSALVLVKISDESLNSENSNPLILPNAIRQPELPRLESNMLEPLSDEPVAEPESIAPVEIGPDVKSRSDMYGHAEDYSWLKGRLQKVHVPGVEWKIRYSPIDEVDQFGGSMVLAPDIRMEDFKNLELVYIKGRQLSGRPSLYVTGPLYRVESIHRLDPIDP